MDHSFNVQLAIDFDKDIATFLNNLAFWTHKNAANRKHYHEGRYWIYNSIPAWLILFPYETTESIRRIIRNCVKHDLLIIGNFNKKSYDNTNWYSLSDKALKYFPLVFGSVLNTPVDSNSTPVDSNRPIPNINTNIKTTNSSSNSKPNPELMELIACYREVFPDNPQPHKRVISTTLQRTLLSLVKRWPELDPESKPITIDGFKRYLIALRGGAPRFSLGEYTTDSGRRKKNSLETFARWDTIVKFLEGAYS